MRNRLFLRLDTMSEPAIRRLAIALTRSVLVLIGVFGILFGFAYLGGLPATGSRGPRLLDSVVPITVWAAVWLLGGLLSTLAAVKAKPVGACVVVGMLFVWGFSFLVSWAVNGPDADRDWLGALVYFVTGLLLWCTVALAAIALRATTKLGS